MKFVDANGKDRAIGLLGFIEKGKLKVAVADMSYYNSKIRGQRILANGDTLNAANTPFFADLKDAENKLAEYGLQYSDYYDKVIKENKAAKYMIKVGKANIADIHKEIVIGVQLIDRWLEAESSLGLMQPETKVENKQ